MLFECFDVHWIDANLWPLRCLGALFPVVASPVTHSLFPLWQHHMQQIRFIPWQRIRLSCSLLLTRIEGKVRPTENSCRPMLLSDLIGVSCWIWIHGCMGQLKHLFPEGSKEIGKQNANTPPKKKNDAHARKDNSNPLLFKFMGAKSATKLCKCWDECFMPYEHGRHMPRLFWHF